MKLLISLSLLTQRLTRVALAVSASGLVLMTFIIGWQVFARYLLNDSPAWSESIALLLMIYYVMLAAAVGVYEGFHLGLTFVLDHLPGASRRRLEMFNFSLMAMFGLIVLINSIELAHITVEHVIPTLGISRAFAYLPFAMAGSLMALFALEKLILVKIEKV